MFFVDLEPDTNNKNIYDTKTLCNAVVNIVPPKKTEDLVQCHRCQEFGHTKSYCRKSVNCVKCGLGHLTAYCTKDADAAPRCVNCLQSHPASYKGCIVYKELLKKRVQLNKNNKHYNYTYNYKSEDYPNLSNKALNSNIPQNNVTYSEVVKDNPQSSFERLENLIQNQIELTNKLINMMTLLIAKLCN